MAERDMREPIEERHVTFARAVVALAREHAMQSIRLEVYGGHDGEPWTRITMDWSQGRHGSENEITMRAEAIRREPESRPTPKDQTNEPG